LGIFQTTAGVVVIVKDQRVGGVDVGPSSSSQIEGKSEKDTRARKGKGVLGPNSLVDDKTRRRGELIVRN